MLSWTEEREICSWKAGEIGLMGFTCLLSRVHFEMSESVDEGKHFSDV